MQKKWNFRNLVGRMKVFIWNYFGNFSVHIQRHTKNHWTLKWSLLDSQFRQTKFKVKALNFWNTSGWVTFKARQKLHVARRKFETDFIRTNRKSNKLLWEISRYTVNDILFITQRLYWTSEVLVSHWCRKSSDSTNF